MACTSINILRYRKYAEELVLKAKKEIPQFPTCTLEIEYHYVSALYTIGGKQYILSLKCSPPLKDENTDKMLFSCAIIIPSLCCEVEMPIMLESVEEILNRLDTEETKNKLAQTFEELMYNIRFHHS